MASPRSPESRFLLAAARAAPSAAVIEELARKAPDWDRVAKRAARHDLAPLLHHNLKDGPAAAVIPAPFLQALEDLHRREAERNRELFRRLMPLLAALAREAIPVVLLKGAALARTIYSDPALRAMKDVDLLVREEDLDAVGALVEELGFAADAAYRPKEWYRENHHHLVPYVDPEGPLRLEIHRHIVKTGTPISLPVGELWRRVRPAAIDGVPALAFAPEALLLHIVLHLAHDNAFLGKARDLADISQIFFRTGEGFDGGDFLESVERSGAQTYAYYALWLARDLVDPDVPAALLDELHPSLATRSLDDRVLKFLTRRAILRPKQAESPVPFVLLADVQAELLSRKSTAAKLRAAGAAAVERLRFSARRRKPSTSLGGAIYRLLVHPLYLIARSIQRVSR